MPVLPKPDYCRPCPFWSSPQYGPGRGFSSLEGNGASGLLVCAQSLGETEEDEGLPLQGASGTLFRRALRESGIRSTGLTITNVLRCRPPDNNFPNRLMLPVHPVDHCRHYLAGAIEQRAPRILLALGDDALRELSADYMGGVTEQRGFIVPSRYGMPLIATYHPSFIIRGAWQLYGAFKRDVAYAYHCAVNGPPSQLETDYALHPELDDVRAFLAAVVAHPDWPISYDVETAGILGEKEPDDWRLKRLIQIQFSVRSGQAIVLPWDDGPYTELAKLILATVNPKWGWNSRLSDDIVLEANGCVVNGERHDLMLAWAHLQPDFAGGSKDPREQAEKGIPSKLMGLQSCASFYCSEVGPWKHLSYRNLQLYGAYDADYTTRCGVGIFRELDRLGLAGGYREHKYELRWVLDDLGDYGLPVDRLAQADLRAYTLTEIAKIQKVIQAQVPASILSIHPKAGYKSLAGKVATAVEGKEPEEWPKTSLKAILSDYDPTEPPLVMAAGHVGYLKQRTFAVEQKLPDGNGKQDHTAFGSEPRWCIERLYNPHASSPNTKAYIRHKGYKMPISYITGNETTGLVELEKLAAETGDEVLKLTYDWRKLRKTGLDFTTGKWLPGEDGRIHPTFRCGTTGSGQTSCTDPNAQQYPEHSGIAKLAKKAICAEPGHLFVKVDMRGFHSRMIGWIANDPDYYKLADFDVHSYITAHFRQLPDAPYLLEMSDEELRVALAAIKREYTYDRNFKVKRVVHGRQFNMGMNKLYQLHGKDFDPPPEKMIQLVGEAKWHDWDAEKRLEMTEREGRRESRKLFKLFDDLFPRTFIIYIENVRDAIYHDTPNHLTTPFGHHRFFWSWDMEQAAAFGPSNCAHCHIQSALIRLRAQGALKAFGACNFTHDALWLHPRAQDVRECVATVQREFNAPSTVLVDSPLGPFQCNSDAEVGPNLAEMKEYTA